MLRFALPLSGRRSAPAGHAPGGTGPVDGASGAGRILVIDDDESMCETLASALTRRGFSVEWRTSGLDALRLLDERDFDVVLTDLHMDGIDGFGICRHVADFHPGLPVVVLTAFGTPESEAAARHFGAWNFLTKPFDLVLLRDTLSDAVQHWRASHE